MRFGLPVDKGRTIDKDSEEFKQLAEELIKRESKRGKKLQVDLSGFALSCL